MALKGKNLKSTRNIFIPDDGGSSFLRHYSIKSKEGYCPNKYSSQSSKTNKEKNA